MPNKVRRYIVAHDLHFPLVHLPTWNAMMEFIEDIKPDGFIFGGDQFDNAEISHHNATRPLYKERRSFLRHQEDFDHRILQPIEDLLRGADRRWIIGNHDYWEFEFIEGHPELEGLIDRPTALGLDRRGWDIIPLGHSTKLGELNVIHGEILTGIGNQAGLYPSRKAVELYSGNVLAGHTHAPQSYSKVSPVDGKKKYMGWIAPVLASTNPAYLHNRPTAWVNGFTLVELHPNGNFNLNTIIVSGGQFAYAGKLYGGK
jgi:hypothetical protein